MSDSNQKSPYQSYMLRIWDEQRRPDLPGEWRYSLEDARTGTRLGFSSLESMIDYLQQEISRLESDTHPPRLSRYLSNTT